MSVITELLFLFFVSFFAATIFPAQSEIILGTLYMSGNHNVGTLIAVATVGNVLGSCVNWMLGRFLYALKDKKWFPLKQKPLDRAVKIYRKYGVWSLLLAWVPIIGDPLTVVAGFLKANFFLFVTLVTIGKSARYVAVLYVIGYRF